MRTFIAVATSVGAMLLGHPSFAQSNASSTTVSTSSPGSSTTTSTTAQSTTDPPSSTEIQPVASTSSPSGFETQPTTETKSGINRPLLLTGFLLLGGTYVASAIDAAESGRPSDHKYLYYPVVGPWLDIAHRDCAARPCGHETGANALLILDGVGQGLGALMMVTSLFIPEKTTKNWILLGNREIQAGPTLVGTGYGMGAVGRF